MSRLIKDLILSLLTHHSYAFLILSKRDFIIFIYLLLINHKCEPILAGFSVLVLEKFLDSSMADFLRQVKGL